MTLEQLAIAVRSNYKSLQEGEIIARIMILSGRNFIRSFEGYKLLVEKKMLPEGFITFPGVWEKILTKYPNICKLMESWDCVPGKISELEFNGFESPKMITRSEAIKILNLAEPEF